MEKKNTILLTVIAIATLLVAMVGATFAYFTAQRGKGAQADITVKTSTSDSLNMGTFSSINILANQDNFGENKGTRSGTSEGEISLKANDATETDKATYCYTAEFYVVSNNFEYSLPTDASKQSQVTGENDPELVLTLTKTPGSSEDLEGSPSPYVYTTKLGEDSVDSEDQTTLDYNENIYKTKVCDDNVKIADENDTCPEEEIKGYDITTLKAGTSIKIQVPNQEEFTHKITAPRDTEVKDTWKAKVYFVNYGYDQQKNTGHLFQGQLKFTTVNCETGEPDVIEP